MQELRVIGVEAGALLVASDQGERFRIPIDEVLHSRLRQASPEQGVGRKLSPREIQEQIRSGMSAEDVASVTGMDVEYVIRYERPIIAEREHIIELALAVPVHLAMDTGPVGGGMTFGTAIRSRLAAANALGERWASWKEAGTGWVVKLSFTADQVDHDARWSFDPKRLSLAPLNADATTLSQQGDVPTSLVPRLRAVAPSDSPAAPTRFDSGAFTPVPAAGPAEPADAPVPESRFAPRAPLHTDSNQTADLLDALRRRRGEREAAPQPEAEATTPSEPVVSPLHPSTGSIRIVDVPLPADPEPAAPEADEGDRPTQPQPGVPPRGGRGRKGRASMPSWDDIVFGARPEDGA